MAAETDVLGEGAAPAFGGGAALALLAAGWTVAGLCHGAGDAATGTGSFVATAAAALWWVAVVVIVRSDITDFIIPDGASAAVALLGVVQAAAVPAMSGVAPVEAALAAAAAVGSGAGAFLLFRLLDALFRRFGRREALGFGDVKLAGACAIWLAPGDAAVALEIAAIAAIAVLLAARLRGAGRDAAVPFGAFMAPAAWLVYVVAPVARELLP